MSRSTVSGGQENGPFWYLTRMAKVLDLPFGDIRAMIDKYSECLNLKSYYSERHIAIHPTKDSPSLFTLMLATLRRSPEVLFCVQSGAALTASVS